jgi:sialate O-acetylesterase
MTALLALCLMLLTADAPSADGIALLNENYQVIQRTEDDKGMCRIAFPPTTKHATQCEFQIDDGQRIVRSGRARWEERPGLGPTALLEGIPVGGPYTVTVTPQGQNGAAARTFHKILVGDIWILGGQSNMFGIDVVKEHLPALPWLHLLDLQHFHRDAHWAAGLPPIHRIPEELAPSYLRNQHPEWTDEKLRQTIAAKTPVGGIDCSYFFARKLYAETHVPIGLIPCATGGALAIWNPHQRQQNRYGFLEHHLQRVGGRVKGLLFFQGEQDAIFGDETQTVRKPSLIDPLRTYAEHFQTFVEALRKDCHDPQLPVILAQICRHHNGEKNHATGWEIVREQQRSIPIILSHAHCVPSLDLDVIDGLHLDYASLERMGNRMAFLAAPYVQKTIPPRSEIKLVAVHRGNTARPTIVVEYSGVTGKLHAPGRPTGFCLKRKETGELLDWIYKVDFDSTAPERVILRTTSVPDQNLVLYYGAGAAPYVNITDENDMPLPAFGPVEIKANTSDESPAAGRTAASTLK